MKIELGGLQVLDVPAIHTEKFKISERSDGALFITAKGNNNKGIHISTMGENEVVINSSNKG